tara:strand:- start:561 stop:794 length:234 start_codon:yes stop_codon:yes gene_type:complete
MDKAIASEKYRQLNQLFKEKRISEGYSMRDLGEMINEPHSFVQKVEANQRKLDLFQYVKYCEALGIDPAKTLKLLMK